MYTIVWTWNVPHRFVSEPGTQLVMLFREVIDFTYRAELEEVNHKERALKSTPTSGSSLDLFASCPAEDRQLPHIPADIDWLSSTIMDLSPLKPRAKISLSSHELLLLTMAQQCKETNMAWVLETRGVTACRGTQPLALQRIQH